MAAMRRDETKIQGTTGAGRIFAPTAACLAVALSLATLAACGGGGGGGGGTGSVTPPPVSDCTGSANSFDSTFEGVQKEIFEKHGCTDDLCHGSAKQGGLQLTADVSYENLLQVHSTESEFNRVEPGDQLRSFLWLKLAAKTDPAKLPPGITVQGSPMPNNLPGLSADELELVRLWIFAGAPKTGTVGGTETLLNACLPPPEPITIQPLDPPAADDPPPPVVAPAVAALVLEPPVVLVPVVPEVAPELPPLPPEPGGFRGRSSTEEQPIPSVQTPAATRAFVLMRLRMAWRELTQSAK